MRTLFIQIYPAIKSCEISYLMTELEQTHKLPMLKYEAWEQQNKEVITLYRKISLSKEF